MAQFPGTLSIVGTTSFLNNTLLVNQGSPDRATAIVTQADCSSGHFAIITGRGTMIGSTPAIEMSAAQCTGVESTVRALRAAARSARPATTKKAAKKATKRRSDR